MPIEIFTMFDVKSTFGAIICVAIVLSEKIDMLTSYEGKKHDWSLKVVDVDKLKVSCTPLSFS